MDDQMRLMQLQEFQGQPAMANQGKPKSEQNGSAQQQQQQPQDTE